MERKSSSKSANDQRNSQALDQMHEHMGKAGFAPGSRVAYLRALERFATKLDRKGLDEAMVADARRYLTGLKQAAPSAAICNNKPRALRLESMEFIRRLLQHVLPSGFRKVRYFGLHHSSKRPLLRLLPASMVLQASRPMRPGHRPTPSPSDRPARSARHRWSSSGACRVRTLYKRHGNSHRGPP